MKFARVMAAVAAVWIGTIGQASAASAQAADPEAPRVSPRAIRTLHSFARCVALQSQGEARALLSRDMSAPTFGNSLLRLLDHNTQCLDHGSLAGNRRLFVARMAEALLVRDLDGADLAQRIALDPSRTPLRARDESELMSLCVVRAAPGEVAALFATQPASDAESAAIDLLAPNLGRCLSHGVQAHFNRPAIRSMLALAAYRLAEHNRAPNPQSASAAGP